MSKRGIIIINSNVQAPSDSDIPNKCNKYNKFNKNRQRSIKGIEIIEDHFLLDKNKGLSLDGSGSGGYSQGRMGHKTDPITESIEQSYTPKQLSDVKFHISRELNSYIYHLSLDGSGSGCYSSGSLDNQTPLRIINNACCA